MKEQTKQELINEHYSNCYPAECCYDEGCEEGYELGKQAEQNRIIEIIKELIKDSRLGIFEIGILEHLIKEIKQGEHTK